MNTTPRKTDQDFLDSEMMSITDVENSPFITVRDYQTKLSKLSNENFTLKLLLVDLRNQFATFLKSRNIQDDVIDLLQNQQNSISSLKAEIAQNSDFINPGYDSKIPPQSPSLKQQLTRVLDDNIQLMKELKEKESQQYDSVVESSALFDEGAQANLTNLELSNQNKELLRENEMLKQKVNELSNEIEEFQKENNDLLKKIAQKDQQGANNLADAHNKIKELQSKNDQLERDCNDALSQLEDLSDQNNKLIDENMKLKEDNNKFGEELSDQNDLVEQLKNANDNLNVGNSKIMKTLNVHYFDDILPTLEDILNKYNELQNQNKQLKKQLSELTSNGNDVSKLKEQIYQLKAEIQRLQLQLQHQKELKTDDYDELVIKNHNLKGKKRAIQTSINRLNSGNNSYVTSASTSFSPQQKMQRTQSPISNIDALWSEAKNANDKLTKDVDELNNLLTEKLYSTINSLSNELSKMHSLQKDNDELRNHNDSLIRDLNNLQNENLALAQQIEIIKAENDDLANENDDLRNQPQFNTIATTPIRFSLNTDSNNSSIIEDLRKQVENLQAENDQLNLDKISEVEQLRAENQKLHDQIRSLSSPRRNGQLNQGKEDTISPELSKYMNEVLNNLDDKISAFTDNFEEHFSRMMSNFQRFISIILALAHSINSGNRQQVQEIAQFGCSIIDDMKRGAHICLSNCKGIKLDSDNPPLISREDRKKLTQLQKKWDTPVVGDLARFIREENEKSMLLNDPTLRNQKEILDFGKLIEQLQFIIHIIWKEFGSGRNEPHISSLLQWKVNGDSITQSTVDLFIENVKRMKELISQQKKIIESGSSSGLSPQVIRLIQLVRNEVSNLSKQMADEYRGLIEFTGNVNY